MCETDCLRMCTCETDCLNVHVIYFKNGWSTREETCSQISKCPLMQFDCACMFPLVHTQALFDRMLSTSAEWTDRTKCDDESHSLGNVWILLYTQTIFCIKHDPPLLPLGVSKEGLQPGKEIWFKQLSYSSKTSET